VCGETRPGFVVKAWTIRALDAAGYVLLAIFLGGVFFDTAIGLEAFAFAVAAAGLLGAKLSGDLHRTAIDWPLGLYVVLAALSAVVHPRADSGSSPIFSERHAALHVALLGVYFYSAVWVLRTPRRLAALAVLLVVAVSVLGIQSSLDQLAAGPRVRMETYPSVPQWSGYPELGLLAVQALPFPVAMAMVSRSRPTIIASLVTACVLWWNALFMHSRSTDFSVVVMYLILLGVETTKLGSRRLVGAAVVIAVLAGIVWLTNARWQIASVGNVVHLRYGLWRDAIRMIGDHPWLGVGIGNYASALRDGYVTSASRFDAHASNMMLHVAAESGIPALIAFVAIWWRALRAGYAGDLRADTVGVVRIGLFVALAAFFVRSMSDHFLGGLPTSDRMSFLVWTVLAGLIAASRLTGHPESRRSGTTGDVAVPFGYRSTVVDG